MPKINTPFDDHVAFFQQQRQIRRRRIAGVPRPTLEVIEMRFRPVAVAIALSTIAPGTAEAGFFGFGRCCCSRPVKCQSVEQTQPCSAYGEAGGYGAGAEGTYNAFAGSDGVLYGVNTLTGQVYKFNSASRNWEKHGTSIPME
jgi:hypothetical protein